MLQSKLLHQFIFNENSATEMKVNKPSILNGAQPRYIDRTFY